MTQLQDLKRELKSLSDPEKASFFPKFFKAGRGEYAEGDKFIGVTVPNQRKIAKKYKDLRRSDIQKLLDSEIHEYRLTALFVLIHQFQEAGAAEQKDIYNFYLKNSKRVNNWDLVDSSAHKVVGAYLFDKDRTILYKLAQSKNLWERRIAIIATAHFISQNDFHDTIKIAEILRDDTHDLIHKAVGWMLREVGKRDQRFEEEFLKKHYKKMPRTMLRYSIERFPEELRQRYLKGRI